MILGLALIPSKAFQDEVNAYRKRYDAHYATIMPHITIKEHFKINEGDLDAVKETIKSRIEGYHRLKYTRQRHQTLRQLQM